MHAQPTSSDGAIPGGGFANQPLNPADQLIFHRALPQLAVLVYSPRAVRRPGGTHQPYWFLCTVSQPGMGLAWESLIQIQTPAGGIVRVVDSTLFSLVWQRRLIQPIID
jgi:hypothetical protein